MWEALEGPIRPGGHALPVGKSDGPPTAGLQRSHLRQGHAVMCHDTMSGFTTMHDENGAER